MSRNRLQIHVRRWAQVRWRVIERDGGANRRSASGLPDAARAAGGARRSERKRGTPAESPGSTGNVEFHEGYMKPINWKCPYCGHAQIVTEETYHNAQFRIDNDLSRYGSIGGRVISTVCSNEDCKEITLNLSLNSRAPDVHGRWRLTDHVHYSWSLLPESSAKPQPDYIPKSIVENYNQACRIRDLSANASAAMSRRCLQGMIRDFCEISKYTLAQEIDTLRKRVDKGEGPKGVNHDTLDAIDHVRSIGAIGAHMEKDINLILDVEPDEAQTLIDLIELLFEEWYVAKHVRQEKLKKLGVVAENKEAKKAQAKLPPPPEKLPAPEPDRG